MRTYYLHKPLIFENDLDSLDLSFVPSSLKRRLSTQEKISLFLAHNSSLNEENYKFIFASRWGEIHRALKLMQQYCEEQEVSPANFSLSVHNAASGLFSLITNNKNAYDSISAKEDTLEVGILSSFIKEPPILFIFAEESIPSVYKDSEKIKQTNIGLSFFVSKNESNFKVGIEFKNQDANNLSFEDVKKFILGKTDKICAKTFILNRL